KGKKHGVLGQEESTETDVSSLLAEQLPELILEMMVKHEGERLIFRELHLLHRYSTTAVIHQPQVQILEGFFLEGDLIDGHAAFDQQAHELISADPGSQSDELTIPIVRNKLS